MQDTILFVLPSLLCGSLSAAGLFPVAMSPAEAIVPAGINVAVADTAAACRNLLLVSFAFIVP
jgi:hypothetical protein